MKIVGVKKITQKHHVSAFAKELSMVLTAGYTLELGDNGFMLTPPAKPLDNYNLHLLEEEVIHHYRNLQNESLQLALVKNFKDEIETYVEIIETCLLSELETSSFDFKKIAEEAVNAIIKHKLSKPTRNLIADILNLPFMASFPAPTLLNIAEISPAIIEYVANYLSKMLQKKMNSSEAKIVPLKPF